MLFGRERCVFLEVTMDYVPPDNTPIEPQDLVESQEYLVESHGEFDQRMAEATMLQGSVAQFAPLYEAYINRISQIQSPSAPEEVARLITVMAQESPGKATAAYHDASYGKHEQPRSLLSSSRSDDAENIVDVTVVVPRAQMVWDLWIPFNLETLVSILRDHWEHLSDSGAEPFSVSDSIGFTAWGIPGITGNPEHLEGPIFEELIGRSIPIVPSSEVVAQCQASGITARHVEVLEDDNFSAVVDEVELACTNATAKSESNEPFASWAKRFVQENPWVIIFSVPLGQVSSGAFQEAGRNLMAKTVDQLRHRRADNERQVQEQKIIAESSPPELKESMLKIELLEAKLDEVIKEKSRPLLDAGDHDITVLVQDKQTSVVIRLDPGIPEDAFGTLEDAVRSADNRRAIEYNGQVGSWRPPN